MSPEVLEHRSVFARRLIAKGRAKGIEEGKTEGRLEGLAEGRMEGRVEERVGIVLRLLTLRFGPLTETIQTLVRHARGEQLDHIVDGLLTAETLEDALTHLKD